MGLIMGRRFTVKLTERGLASKIADLVVKRCILGFARHKPITSSCPSQGLVLTMEAFFELPSELRERVNAWRMKKTKEALAEAGIA